MLKMTSWESSRFIRRFDFQKQNLLEQKKKGRGPKELLEYLSIEHLNMRDYPFENEFQKSSSNKIRKNSIIFDKL